MSLSPLQIEIGRYLALQASGKQLTTYPELAKEIHWGHPFGRGLGSHLWELLNWTHQRNLPCLTAILCKAGTRSPPDDALRFIRQIYGQIDVGAEQEKVFAFDWADVVEFAFQQGRAPDIDFDRIYATRTWGFDPKSWGMTGFTFEKTRDRILEEMRGNPIYLVYFCSQHSEVIEGSHGQYTIAERDRARVLGLVEVQPKNASHQSHTHPDAIAEMQKLWGKTRWEFGLANTRAWRFEATPWTKDVLPHARSRSWEATQGIVRLTEEEKSYLRQYRLIEVPVFGQVFQQSAYTFREPMHTTYLAICDAPEVLKKTPAPKGTILVKIGVSGDTDRRLRDLNNHHFARIFGLQFRMMATQRWATQDEALSRETAALEWGLENAELHASGEYFYMTERQMFDAVAKVKPPKRGR